MHLLKILGTRAGRECEIRGGGGGRGGEIAQDRLGLPSSATLVVDSATLVVECFI